MNKLVLVAVAMLLPCIIARAQEGYSLTVGEESRNVDVAVLRASVYLGQYEGLHCWAGGLEGKRKAVMLTDHNMEPLSVMELPEGSKGCRMLTATMDDGKAYLTLVDSGYSKMTFIYSSAIDLATMTPAEGTEAMRLVDSLGYGRNDRCYVWGATSPARRYAAIVYAVEYTERHQYSARARLYDAGLREQWARDYAIGSMESLAVTDDGTVVSLGYEEDGDETHFIFNVLDSRHADTYDAVVQCPHVRQLRLAGVAGRKAMGVGTFSPADGRYRDELCEGVLTMAFDIDSAVLTGFNMRTFQNEELNIMLNTKTKKVQRYQDIDLVSVSGQTITDWGVVVAVGRNWKLRRTEDNGTTTLVYHRMGLHLVAMDTSGRVTWVRNLRRNDLQRGADGLLDVDLTSRDGITYIARSEPRRSPAIYDIGRAAKPLAVGDKASLMLYTIAADGEVEKHLLAPKTQYSLLRTIMRPEGTLLLVGANGKRMKLASLPIK